MFSKMTLAACVAAFAFAAPALAQETMDHSKMDHSKMDMTGAAKGDTGPSSTAFAAANAAMHKAMDITFTGNADMDFVRGMIAHHEGAIAMAKIELQYGKDDGMRKLAEDIIAAQEGEITMMKAWLAKNGG